MNKISINPEKVQDGLAQLVLTLLETLRQLMEKQATRRIREGSLTDEEIEQLGLTFMRLRTKIREVATVFNIQEKDLGLNLGPFGELVDPQERINNVTLVDLLDKVIEKGVVVFGDLGISVADVELISIQLRLIVSSVKRNLKTEAEEKRTNIARRTARRALNYIEPEIIAPEQTIVTIPPKR